MRLIAAIPRTQALGLQDLNPLQLLTDQAAERHRAITSASQRRPVAV